MTWESSAFWFTKERYEIRMVRPDLWIMFSPDGHVDTDISKQAVERLAEDHLRAHPIMPY